MRWLWIPGHCLLSHRCHLQQCKARSIHLYHTFQLQISVIKELVNCTLACSGFLEVH